MGWIVGVACAVAVTVGLVVLAAFQVMGESSPRRRQQGLGGGGAGAGGGGVLGELHALFSPGKQVQVEQRREQLSRRDDTQAGAPPHFGVDLDRGVVVLHSGPTGGRPGAGSTAGNPAEDENGSGSGNGNGSGNGRPGQVFQEREQSTRR